VSVEISVSSRHVEVPPAVKAAAVDKIGRLDRYVDGMDRAEAHFSEERNRRIEQREVLEVTMYGHGHQVRAKVAAADQFAAVDAAVAKLETQLHKLKNRLVAKYHGKGHVTAKGAGAADGRAADEAAEEPPRLVKTKRFAMKPMTTDEAILQMDLLGHEVFFFHNADTGDRAVLYRRDDGDIGLIEAER
jgi:putative sigma-54 modulation protein